MYRGVDERSKGFILESLQDFDICMTGCAPQGYAVVPYGF
jgi:hypothetical protein